ncbi:MAG: efflux RND transporter periplasmic adaptor subunit [Verrucomicrobiota bacterium]
MKPFILLLTTLLLTQCKPKEEAAGAPPAMPVEVAIPETKTIALKETYTGRFSPVEEVKLQARVSGYLESVHFKEGQKINKGDLMFRIDPRVFDASQTRAEAVQKQALAKLDLAKSTLKRAENLVSQNAISKEEFDTRKSELAQAEADLLVAEADLRSAKLEREFADVQAPISGIAGSFNVTVGNFINGGTSGATPLTSIVPHHPIYCHFEVDERRVLQMTRMFIEGKSNGREGSNTPVEIALSDRDDFDFKGVINFTENQLDPNTATLQIRALVENENEFLTPGLFARVRVPIGVPEERLLVRDAALGFDQDKRFAWVLLPNNMLERRFVEIGTLDGNMRVITGGLSKDEKIAVSGLQLLRPNMPIQPIDVPMTPSVISSK